MAQRFKRSFFSRAEMSGEKNDSVAASQHTVITSTTYMIVGAIALSLTVDSMYLFS